MKYAGIIKNDTANAPGVCVSFYTQGCDHRCPGCHNPETWDFEGGKDFTPDILHQVDKALTANNVHRDFCLLGGEPLHEQNIMLSYILIEHIKQNFPDVKIYIWTGYVLEDLRKREINNNKLKYVLDNADYLIDGPFILAQRDITLWMRGSPNQRIWDLKNNREIKRREDL